MVLPKTKKKKIQKQKKKQNKRPHTHTHINTCYMKTLNPKKLTISLNQGSMIHLKYETRKLIWKWKNQTLSQKLDRQ